MRSLIILPGYNRSKYLTNSIKDNNNFIIFKNLNFS